MEVTLDELADAIGAAVPDLDADEQRITVEVYRLLADGEPVSVAELARAIDVPSARVEDALASWPGVYRDQEGRVIGFWGLAISPLDPEYRVEIDGKTVYAWCAWDNLFIPAILGKTARVGATCPVTGQPVSLVVDPAGVREVMPAGAVVSIVIPEGPFGYDVIESFCHRVFFFASEDVGSTWVTEHEGTTLLSVEQAFELGRRHVRRIAPDVFGDAGEPDLPHVLSGYPVVISSEENV
jgi:alkylmercury lyase